MQSIFTLILAIALSGLDRPADIPSKITELRSKSWYADKTNEWDLFLANNSGDESAWMHYFLAAHYAEAGDERLDQIQLQITEQFPDSFLSHYSNFKRQGWSVSGIEELKRAITIDNSRKISFEDQVIFAELSQSLDRKSYTEKLFESNLIHSSTLNYSYNLLMSVAENGLLIVDGVHLTIPLWILQDVMGVREDISILNLELAADQPEYVDSILKEKGFSASVEELLSGDNGSAVYYALTLPRELIDQKERNLYVVGLASTQSSEQFNHFETLKTNIEDRFLLDYLTVDFNGEPKTATGKVLSTNYIVPLLLLKEFYDELNESGKSAELTSQIQLLAKDTQMQTRVALLLNKKTTPRNFKVVEIETKELEKSLKRIRGNIYASERELTNKDYWFFMEYLRTNGYDDLYNQFIQDISDYDELTKSLMSRYHYTPVNYKELDSKGKKQDLLRYPAIDFKHEAAKAYCEWLTVQYNSQSKRKYKKVRFRLPTSDEWTMAALGYKDFQSWTLEENVVSAKAKEGKAPLEKFSLAEHSIDYPWGISAWDLKNSITNRFDCYLANVKVVEEITCKGGIKGDGWSFTSPATNYFANGMGLYDVIGNVAEMIDQPGIAMGGSWNDSPENCTITSSSTYEGSDIKVGMRLFMEVVEQ